MFPSPQVSSEGATAAARMAQPTVLRSGLRYLGRRVGLEAGADLFLFRSPTEEALWEIGGASVIDETGQTAALSSVPQLGSHRSYATVHAAADVEAIPGFVWLTAGVGYRTATTKRGALLPIDGGTGGPTLAFGVEASIDQVVLCLGISRWFGRTVTLSESEPAQGLVNPFPGGSAPVGLGRHTRARDTVGLSIEVAWE